MLAIPLTNETRARLADLAMTRGISEADLARDLIESSIEDLDDIQMAVSRLQHPQPTLSSAEAREALGLDD